MREEFGLAAFRSRQQVLRFEQALIREGIPVRIMTTPRDVALGCGLSARFDLKDAQRVKAILDRERPGNLVGIYRASRDGTRTRVTGI